MHAHNELRSVSYAGAKGTKGADQQRVCCCWATGRAPPASGENAARCSQAGLLLHLCVNVGLRFCTNAPMPSFWSSSAQQDLQRHSEGGTGLVESRNLPSRARHAKNLVLLVVQRPAGPVR